MDQSLIYHFDCVYLSKHLRNSYVIQPTKDRTPATAEKSDLGWTDSNKINLSLQKVKIFSEHKVW